MCGVVYWSSRQLHNKKVPNSNLAVLLDFLRLLLLCDDDQVEALSNEIMEVSSDGATLYLTRTLVLIIFLLVIYIERHLHNLRAPNLEGH